MQTKPVYIAEPEPVLKSILNALPETLHERTTEADSAKFLLGWREWLALPEIKIPAIKAKIDTGARTSALHTHDYEIFKREGKDWVRFHVHPLRRTEKAVVACEAEVADVREVKDSGGHPEKRPFILTVARIGEFEWPVELSLTNRESMKFRMLLGREALAGYFLVDSVGSYLLGENRSREYKL